MFYVSSKVYLAESRTRAFHCLKTKIGEKRGGGGLFEVVLEVRISLGWTRGKNHKCNHAITWGHLGWRGNTRCPGSDGKPFEKVCWTCQIWTLRANWRGRWVSSIVDISNIKKGGGFWESSFVEAIQNILLSNSMGFFTLSIIIWVEKTAFESKIEDRTVHFNGWIYVHGKGYDSWKRFIGDVSRAKWKSRHRCSVLWVTKWCNGVG